MSNYRIKTEFENIGHYGLPEKETVYAVHQGVSDTITFFDKHGVRILLVADQPDNLLEAINRLANPFTKDTEKDLIDRVQFMDKADNDKIQQWEPLLPENCEHHNFRTHVRVARLTDTEGGPVTGFMADIEICCAQCLKPFEFVGMNYGYSPNGPCKSVEGTEARVPIKPVV